MLKELAQLFADQIMDDMEAQRLGCRRVMDGPAAWHWEHTAECLAGVHANATANSRSEVR